MSLPLGKITSPHKVEEYIIELAQRWYPHYLRKAAEDAGYEEDYFPVIKSYVQANDFEGYWPEDDLPALLVMWAGMAEPPSRRGDGKWDVKWLYGCAIVVSTDTRLNTRVAQSVHIAAFTDMMLKHRSLEKPEEITGVDWVDGRPAPMPPDPQNADRMMGAAQMFFSVGVPGVVRERELIPATDPPEDPDEEPTAWPVATTASATISKKEIEE